MAEPVVISGRLVGHYFKEKRSLALLRRLSPADMKLVRSQYAVEKVIPPVPDIEVINEWISTTVRAAR